MNQFEIEPEIEPEIEVKIIYNLSYIPFAEIISNKPICTFVKNKSKNKDTYSFGEDKDVITMSVKQFNNYVKKNKYSNTKIIELKLERRRHKNRIYSRTSRLLKRKNNITDSGTI